MGLADRHVDQIADHEAIAAGLAGVTIVIRPGMEGFSVYSIWALAAVGCITLREITTRKLSADLPSLPVALATAIAIGGLGAHVLTMASDEGLTDGGLKIRTMRLPDLFLDHDDPVKQYDEAGLNAPQIVDKVLSALRHNSAGVKEARA